MFSTQTVRHKAEVNRQERTRGNISTMTPQQAYPLRSEHDDDDDLVEPSGVAILQNVDISKSVELDSNNNKHPRTRTNTVQLLSDQQSTGNNVNQQADKHLSSSTLQAQLGNKQRSRGRTRRHFSRMQASLLAGSPWEVSASFEMDASTKTQSRRPSARSSSTKRCNKRGPDLVIATTTPVCQRVASEPAVPCVRNVSSTAQGGQNSLNRMRSFQRKAPHEVHREMVQKLSSSDSGSARVFGQLSFGVVRLMSEEDRLQMEDGMILSGGVYKKQPLSKRSSLEDQYEKGSLKDLERRRSNRCDGAFGSQGSAT